MIVSKKEDDVWSLSRAQRNQRYEKSENLHPEELSKLRTHVELGEQNQFED